MTLMGPSLIVPLLPVRENEFIVFNNFDVTLLSPVFYDVNSFFTAFK